MIKRNEERIKACRDNLELNGLFFSEQNGCYEEWRSKEKPQNFVQFYYGKKRVVIGTYGERVNGFGLSPWKLKAIAEYEDAIFIEYEIVVC